MGLVRKILFPFSLMYGGVMLLRNGLYDSGILKTHRYELPVICVGNLSVGGTGKSPMVEYLISLLKEDRKLATLSRGYKRTTTGFHLLSGKEKASETGDEPLQFKKKFPEVLVAVDEKRSHGIEKLLELEPEVILLDDAFQHRRVTAGLHILLTAFDNLYSADFMLPTGNLREPVQGAGRAQIVVVTKCPEILRKEEKQQIKQQLQLHRGQELFFSRVGYGEAALSASSYRELHELKAVEFCLVTGIANPEPLTEYLEKNGLHFSHLAFPDHHNFSASELQEIRRRPLILTTEKDYMRLKGEIPEEKLFYLPIRTEFLDGEERFNRLIRNFTD